MSSTPAQEQDKLRNHERSVDPEQTAVAWMCAEFGWGPSKASRTVRKFTRDRDRNGWSDDDFIDYLVTESIVAKHRAGDAAASLRGYADPTGEAAVKAVAQLDPKGERARWLADRRYTNEQGQRSRAYVGLVPSLPGGPAFGRAERNAAACV